MMVVVVELYTICLENGYVKSKYIPILPIPTNFGKAERFSNAGQFA
jgi:hypothetical protein